jgi:hypothetical protein
VNRAVALVLAMSPGLACAGGTSESRDTATAATRRSTVATSRADSSPTASSPATMSNSPNAAGCVSEGKWQACSIEKRLTDAGFVPINKGPAPGGIFEVKGTTYALGSAELSVYIFESAETRASAIAAIDTVTVTKGSGASPWSMTPTLITSNNIAAVLVSDNGRLIERVQLAITAGLPSASH